MPVLRDHPDIVNLLCSCQLPMTETGQTTRVVLGATFGDEREPLAKEGGGFLAIAAQYSCSEMLPSSIPSSTADAARSFLAGAGRLAARRMLCNRGSLTFLTAVLVGFFKEGTSSNAYTAVPSTAAEPAFASALGPLAAATEALNGFE